ncbi:hypothetical protein PROFUN_00259 [Planoprotostelium fungivorum]|uniref:Elongator complex protein 4 n=1 Tax=Planoprotostelium fungivorum TaxID=1890364 RepID=A0A2P6NXV1_9EUKA|nr:hypothetical protein PROFUN_00259 [Planoprotostelium fungivorum]
MSRFVRPSKNVPPPQQLSSVSSFRPVAVRKPNAGLPPGCRPSVQNGQLLNRHPFLDSHSQLLGGGLSVGTITIVEEDRNSSYYLALLKYFIAEGLAVDHEGLVYTSQRQFVSRLPKNLTAEYEKEKEEEEKRKAGGEINKTETPSLTIAWQYEKYLNKDAGVVAHKSGSLKGASVKSFCHSFDLGKSMRDEYMSSKKMKTVDPCELSREDVYQSLLDSISSIIEKEYSTDGKVMKQPNILRIGIHSLCCPSYGPINERSLLLFLHRLKGLLRHSLAVCMITLPSHIIGPHLTKSVHLYSDTLLSVSSFESAVGQVSSAFDEYDGQLVIKKLLRINSLVAHTPETLHYVFKMKRRKLLIEILTLGPEESRSTKEKEKEEAGAERMAAANISSVACAPAPSKRKDLEF